MIIQETKYQPYLYVCVECKRPTNNVYGRIGFIDIVCSRACDALYHKKLDTLNPEDPD